jgi:PAS domain S-box-containing protein
MEPAARSVSGAPSPDAIGEDGVLQTGSEPALADLASIAAQICGTPIAFISFVDEHRQWFRAQVGTTAAPSPLRDPFCSAASLDGRLLIVPDARRDERFAQSPLVTGDPHIVFYAGAPLVSPDGAALGAICVIDHVPRSLTASQQKALMALGRQVMSHFELRRRTAELAASERLLRTIVDSEPDCVKLMSADGSLAMMNRAGLAIIEADSFETVRGTSVYAFVHEDDRDAMRALTDRVFRGQEGTMQFRLTGLKGKTRWLETHAVPLLDENGIVRTLLGITRDITTRKATEDSLRDSERDYRMLFEQATDGIFVSRPDGTFIDVNTAACEITGYRREQLLTRRLVDLVMPAERDRLTAELARVDAGRPVNSQWQFRHRDGNPFAGELTIKRLPDGRLQSFVRDLTDRKVVEDALREMDERLRRAVNAGQIGLWDWDLRTGNVYYSPEWKQQIGYEDHEIRNHLDEWRSRVHPDDLKPWLDAIDRCIGRSVSHYEMEFRIRHRNGSYRHILAQAALVVDDAGQPIGIRGVHVDITERAQLQAQLLQAQKMESLGRLAGGIAHDFNNLLTVINGTANMAVEQLRDGDSLRTDLEQIHLAGTRAANLTRQLLAISRQQILAPEILDLGEVIGSMQTMLQRLIGEHIELTFQPEPALGHVRADRSQIEQVVLNLAVNARDAMPYGGRLTIWARPVVVDEAEAEAHPGMAAGRFVRVIVQDTGVGMDEGTRRRAFEPFFTSKPKGEGTGLGLSTVYGIIKQSGGSITVQSEPGQGATFVIDLPRLDAAPDDAGRQSRPPAAEKGTETILIVEDERSLRNLCRRILQTAGYTVLEAGTGAEALLVLEKYSEPVHLMLTDVVMPGMSGRELAQRLADVRPEMKVLYTSGYTDDAMLRHGALDDPTRFVAKPYTAEDLKRKVRTVLDS